MQPLMRTDSKVITSWYLLATCQIARWLFQGSIPGGCPPLCGVYHADSPLLPRVKTSHRGPPMILGPIRSSLKRLGSADCILDVGFLESSWHGLL